MPEDTNPQPQPTQPTTNKKSLNWKSILIGVVIGVVIVGLGVIIFILLQPKPTEPTTTVTTKKATPSAKISTPSAQKDETADWKTLTTKSTTYGDSVKFSFKYPSDFRIINDEGYEVATNDPNYSLGITTPGSFSVLARPSPNKEKPFPSTETTLGGKKALRGSKITEDSGGVTYYIESIFTEEDKTTPFIFSCSFIPKEGVETEKICDQIASTFEFLD